jgi:uncharacterized phage protein gp47/JayE
MGMTAEGFSKPTLDEIKKEIEDALKSTFGAFINLLPGSIFSLLVGIYAEREAEIWEAMEDVYYSQYPNTADGVSLDNVGQLSGITRLTAAKSRVLDYVLYGDTGTEVPAGTRFSVQESPSSQFETVSTVTLVAGQNEKQLITLPIGIISGYFRLRYWPTDDINDALMTGEIDPNAIGTGAPMAAAIQTALRGLSEVLNEITVTSLSSTEYEVEFAGGLAKNRPHRILTAINQLSGIGDLDIDIEETQAATIQGTVDLIAVNDGPTDAPIGTLTVIDTPVSGLESGVNPNDVVLGRFTESDAEYRQRRRQTLALGGSATVVAITSRLRNLQGVIDVKVFENDTNETVGYMPPKSIEAVVDGGANDDIAQTVWANKPGGIQAIGNITEEIVDVLGVTRLVKFSRPAVVPIYISLDITKNAKFPTNGAGQIQAKLIEYGISLAMGETIVVYPVLVGQLMTIPGILDVRVRIGTAPVSTTPNAPAVDDNIALAANARAQFSEVNTNVNLLP